MCSVAAPLFLSDTMSAEFDWELLLDWLENQKVIPVIGQDLLYLDSEKGPIHLYALIADRLIAKHRVSKEQLPADYTIADVACAVPDFGKDPQLVYSQVATAYKFVVNEQINGKLPEPIRQLARIPFFRLFVALTFDDLLERAIRLERRTDLHVISNEQHEVPDLTDQQKINGLPIVFRHHDFRGGICVNRRRHAGIHVSFVFTAEAAKAPDRRIISKSPARDWRRLSRLGDSIFPPGDTRPTGAVKTR